VKIVVYPASDKLGTLMSEFKVTLGMTLMWFVGERSLRCKFIFCVALAVLMSGRAKTWSDFWPVLWRCCALLRVLMDDVHPVSMTADCLFAFCLFCSWLTWVIVVLKFVPSAKWTFGCVGLLLGGFSTSSTCVGSGVS